MMMRNYRSTPQILNAANSLIAKNRNRIRKDLLPQLSQGMKPVWYHAKDAEEEARWIAEGIRKLEENGTAPTDIAVLYRAHYVTRILEEVFMKAKIPYLLYSGVQFYNRAEIKDALSYLRLIAFNDDLSFMRIVNRPKRNIGEQRMLFLKRYAEENGCLLFDALVRNLDQEIFRKTKAAEFAAMIESYRRCCADYQVSELLAQVLEESGYEEMLRTEGSGERLDNLAELKQSVYEYETTCGEETQLENYLAHIALFSNADRAEGRNAVKCMTVHTAKGLEFPVVFLCALEEGVFPARKTASAEAMEEERRLAFVAVTRAEKRLYLSDSEGRNIDGSYRYPSRFLLDIDSDCVIRENEPEENLIRRAREEIAWSEKDLHAKSAERLAAGTRILHPVFGPGEIVGTDEERSAYVIRFDRLQTDRKISFRAALERENA